MMDRVAAGIKNCTTSVIPQSSDNNPSSETASPPESGTIFQPIEETDSDQPNITRHVPSDDLTLHF